MKFSIIIPVYNVEPYLEKCLDSVTNQTYKNFEVIIVNDSSPDNSQKIIDKYVKKDKRFKGYIKENGGVSSVRNYGLQKVSGDYILFLDGDDYIDISLLEELSKKIANQYPDIVRFSLSTVTEKNELIKEIPIKETDNTKEEAIDEIVKNEFVDVVWAYAYNTTFFKKNKFTFTEGKTHEDFGIILLILATASTIKILDFKGYYYVQRSTSIMNVKEYSKIRKRVADFFYFHLNNKKYLPTDYCGKLLLSFSASCTITKGRELNNEDLDKYIEALKKYHVVKDIYSNNIKRIIKKLYLKFNLKKYIISLRSK